MSPLALLLHCSSTHSHLSTRASLQEKGRGGRHLSQLTWTAFPTLHTFTRVLSTRVPSREALPPRQGNIWRSSQWGQAKEAAPEGRTTQVEGRAKMRRRDTDQRCQDHHPGFGLTKGVKIKQRVSKGLPEAGSTVVGLKPHPQSLPQWHSFV